MLGLLLVGVAPWPPQRGETLAEALARAYARNPRLEAARAALRAADEGIPLARAPGRPQLISTSSAAVMLWATTLPVARQALSLSQNLYSGGGIRAATREAERRVDGESARLTRGTGRAAGRRLGLYRPGTRIDECSNSRATTRQRLGWRLPRRATASASAT